MGIFVLLEEVKTPTKLICETETARRSKDCLLIDYIEASPHGDWGASARVYRTAVHVDQHSFL